jgi:hypothetical protein
MIGGLSGMNLHPIGSGLWPMGKWPMGKLSFRQQCTSRVDFTFAGNTLRALSRESPVSLASAIAFSRRPSSGRLLLRDLSRADNCLGTLS